jgi:hypothetical protein
LQRREPEPSRDLAHKDSDDRLLREVKAAQIEQIEKGQI